MKLIPSVLCSFKLLFAGELLDILVFSLSLHAPHIDTGATSCGYEKEREYTTICAARVYAGFARSYAGAARAATMACNIMRSFWIRGAMGKLLETALLW
jgi:hypothetical protein